MGHKPYLPTPSQQQNLVGWSILMQLKLYLVSGSAWSKAERHESGSQSNKRGTQKPGYEGTQSPELLYLQRLVHSSCWFWTLRNITPAWQGFWLTAHTELNRRVCQPTAWESKIQLHLAALTCSSSLVQNHLWAPAYTGDHSHFSHIPEVVGTLILRKHRAWRDTYELHLCLWTLFIFSPAVCIYFWVLRQWV